MGEAELDELHPRRDKIKWDLGGIPNSCDDSGDWVKGGGGATYDGQRIQTKSVVAGWCKTLLENVKQTLDEGGAITTTTTLPYDPPPWHVPFTTQPKARAARGRWW